MIAKRIAVAAALLGAMVLILTLYLPGVRPPAPAITMASGTVAIGGPFALTDTKGNAVTEASLAGRYSLIFFGFTHCPDICPLTLQTITQALEAAGPAADNVQPVFITLDPERDTPEAMAAYVASFHPRFVALTGTPEQVKGTIQSYKVYAAKIPVKDGDGNDTGDYSLSHTGYIYLMDTAGKYLAHFDKNAKAADIAARLRQLPTS
jgi:protein SCO1